MPKYVVSRTLSDEQANWNNTTVIRDDLAGNVRKIVAENSGDVLVGGSAQLAQALAAEALVDEYHLMVFPIASEALGPEGVLALTYTSVRS